MQWKTWYKTSLDSHWRVSVVQHGTNAKKIHIRYYNDQGLPTRLGISLTAEQYEWMSQLKFGIMSNLHVVPLPDRYLLFKESVMGYVSGCSVPIAIINMIPALYPKLAPFIE